MSDHDTHPTKIFTVEQANACLPLVRAIAADMIQLSSELNERRRRLEQLTAARGSRQDVYGEELEQVADELNRDAERLQEYLDEIAQLGAEPKDPELGLIDFPAMLDGRFVYLCWKYNEPEVLYWHELEAGFAGRQPLTAGSLAEGETSHQGDAVEP